MMGIRRLCRFWVRLIFLPFFYCGIFLAFFLFGCILCALNLITTFRPPFGLLHLRSPAKKYPVHLSIASSAAAPLHAEEEEEEDITSLFSSNRDDDCKLGLNLAAMESLISDGSSVAQRVDMQEEEEEEEEDIESLCSSNHDNDCKCGLDLAVMESFRSDGSSVPQRVDMQEEKEEEEEEEEGITSLCSSNCDGVAVMECLRFDGSSAAQRVDMPPPEEADPPSLVMTSSTALLHEEEEEEEENIALCSSNGNEDRRCGLDSAMTESLSSDSSSFAQRVEMGLPQEDDPSPPVMASSTTPLHPEKEEEEKEEEEDRALCSSNGDEDCKDGLDSAMTESLSSDSSSSVQIVDMSPPDEDDSSAEVTSSSTTPLLAEEEVDRALCSSNGNEDCKDGLDLAMMESLSSDSSSSAQIANMSPSDEKDPSAAVMSSSTAPLLAEEVDRALCSSNDDEECKDGLDLVMTESLSSDRSSFAQKVEMGSHQKDDRLPAAMASSTTPLLAEEEEDRALCSSNVDEDRKDGLDSAMAESLSSDISSISQRVDMLPPEEDDAPPPVMASSTTSYHAEEEYRAIYSSNDDEDRKSGLDSAMTERLSSDSSSFGQRVDMAPPEQDDPSPAVMASSNTPLHAEKEDEGLGEEDRALCSSNGDEDRKDGLDSAMTESLSSDNISFAQGVDISPPQEYDPPHAVMNSLTIPLHAEEEEAEEGRALCCSNGNGDRKDGLDSAMMESLSSDSIFFAQKVEMTPPQEDDSPPLVMASSTTALHTEAAAEEEYTVLCSSNGYKDHKDWLNLVTTESLHADSISFAQRVDMVPPQKDDPPSAIKASSAIALDAEEKDEDDTVFRRSNDDEDRKDGFDSVMTEILSSDSSSFTPRVDMLPLEEDDPPPVEVLASVEDHSSSSSSLNCLTGNEALIKLESRSLKTDESFDDVAMTLTASIEEHSPAELLQSKADFKTGNVFMPESSDENSFAHNGIELESRTIKADKSLDDATMVLKASIEEPLSVELLQSKADSKTGNKFVPESSDENSVAHNRITLESGILKTDKTVAEGLDDAAMALTASIEEASSVKLLQSKAAFKTGNMFMTEKSDDNYVNHNGIKIESGIMKTDETISESFDDADMALTASIKEPSPAELLQSEADFKTGYMILTERPGENSIGPNGIKLDCGTHKTYESFDHASMAPGDLTTEPFSAEFPQSKTDLKTGNMIMPESCNENNVAHSGIERESGIMKIDEAIAESFDDASMTPRTSIEESLSTEADSKIGHRFRTESSDENSVAHNVIKLESGHLEEDARVTEDSIDLPVEISVSAVEHSPSSSSLKCSGENKAYPAELSSGLIINSTPNLKKDKVSEISNEAVNMPDSNEENQCSMTYFTENEDDKDILHTCPLDSVTESRTIERDESIAESFDVRATAMKSSIEEGFSGELPQSEADFKTVNMIPTERSSVNSATPNEIKLESGIAKMGEGLDDAAMALEASIEETLPAELLQSEADFKTGNMIMTESSDENSVAHNGIKIESGIMNTDEAIAESFDYAAMAARDSIEGASSAELLQSKADSEIGNMSMTESSSENSVAWNGSKIASGIMEIDNTIAEIFDDAAMAQRYSIEQALSAELPETEADLKTGNMIMTESSGENSVTHSGIKLESGILKTDETIAECFNDASMTPRVLIEELSSTELPESKADFEIGNMITTESSYGNSITHNGIELESGITKMDEATAESFKDEVMALRASIKETSSTELLQSEADFKIGNVFRTESSGENSVAHSVMKLESGIIKNDETIAESFEDAAMTVRDSIAVSSSAELPQSDVDFKIGVKSMTESSDENSIPENIIKLQSALLEEDARVTESPIDPPVKISASTEDISPSSSKRSTRHSSGSLGTSAPNLERENITKISYEPMNMPDFKRISKNNAAMTESSCKDPATLKALKVESCLTEVDNITKISKDPEGIKDSTEEHHSKDSEIQPLDSMVESGFIEDISMQLIRISSSPHTQTEGIFPGSIDQQARPAIELSRADSESLELTVMHSDSIPSNESKEGNDRSFGFTASQNTPFNSNRESDSDMEQFGVLGQLHPNMVPIGGIQTDTYTSDWSLLVPDEAEASVVIDTDKKPTKNSGIDEDHLLEKVCESETSLDQDENPRKEELLILNDIEIIKTILGCNIKSDTSLIQQIETLSRFIGVEPIPPMQNMGALEIAIQELNLLKFIIGIK